MAHKPSALLTVQQNKSIIELLGDTEGYVISVVKSFEVKPKFQFPENESAVLCVVLHVLSKRFYLRLFSLKLNAQKALIWEQEITDRLKIKIKSNVIAIDGNIGKIRIHFQSKDEANDVFKNTTSIVEIKVQEVKAAIEKAVNFGKNSKKNSQKKRIVLDGHMISSPIGFRHLNTVQMAIIEKIPSKLRSTPEGMRIIEEFFKENENEVSSVKLHTEEQEPKAVVKVPSRPATRPVKKEEPVNQQNTDSERNLGTVHKHPSRAPPKPAPPIPPAGPRITHQHPNVPPPPRPSQNSQEVFNVPAPPPAPASPNVPGPPPPPMFNPNFNSPSTNTPQSNSIADALKNVTLKKPEEPKNSGVDPHGDLMEQIKMGFKLKPKDERKELPTIANLTVIDDLADRLKKTLRDRFDAMQPDYEEEDRNIRDSFMDPASPYLEKPPIF